MKTERRFFNSIVLFLLILTSFGSVFGVRGCLSTVHADSVPKLSARKFTDALTDMTAEYDKNVTQRQAERDPYISERLIVKSTDENLDPDDYGAVDAIHDRNGTYILQFESSGEAKRAAQSIAAEDSTVYVEPDGYLFACDFSDSLNEDLWGTSAAMVGADQYAESLTGSAGSVEVAVLDTGISFTSPKLAGRLDTVRAKSFATYEGDLLNVDQSQESSTELKSRHGTHVAGIIVQCTEALPNVVILPVRVLNNKGAGYVSQVANGIRYAADQGASVINMSLSNRLTVGGETIRLAVDYAISRGAAVVVVSGNDGTVYLKRMVTTYKTTPAGASDTSYQQVETVFTLSYLRWDWNNYMASRYPHAKLADDGNNFGPGQTVMTPKLGAGELLSRYEYWMSKALVQNFDSFKENLVVVRDPDDKTALQFLIPAELISQFFIGKSKLQFK